MKKIIISLICLLVCSAIATAVVLKLNEKKETTEQSSKSASNINESDRYYHAKLQKGAKAVIVGSFNLDGSGEPYDFEIKVNDITVTKEQGDFDRVEDDNKLVVDENGTILNDYSYVVANVDVKNISGHEFDATINNISLYSDKFEMYYEPWLYNSDNKSISDKHYFLIDFTPNYENNFNLVYFVKDEELSRINSDEEMVLICSFVNSFPNVEDIPVVKKE